MRGETLRIIEVKTDINMELAEEEERDRQQDRVISWSRKCQYSVVLLSSKESENTPQKQIIIEARTGDGNR